MSQLYALLYGGRKDWTKMPTPKGFMAPPLADFWLDHFKSMIPPKIFTNEGESKQWINAFLTNANIDARNAEKCHHSSELLKNMADTTIPSTGSAFTLVPVQRISNFDWSSCNVQSVGSLPGVLDIITDQRVLTWAREFFHPFEVPLRYTSYKWDSNVTADDLIIFNSLVFMRTGLWQPADPRTTIRAAFELRTLCDRYPLATVFNQSLKDENRTMAFPDQYGKNLEIQLKMLRNKLFLDHVISIFLLPLWGEKA